MVRRRTDFFSKINRIRFELALLTAMSVSGGKDMINTLKYAKKLEEAGFS
jgi:hypothetical protein